MRLWADGCSIAGCAAASGIGCRIPDGSGCLEMRDRPHGPVSERFMRKHYGASGDHPVAAHRCSGCDHRWDGQGTGVELCGDCWRAGQAVILGHGAGFVPMPMDTWRGECGHHWLKSEIENCPICALKREAGTVPQPQTTTKGPCEIPSSPDGAARALAGTEWTPRDEINWKRGQ